MSAIWPTLPFDEAVEDASGGNIKTKQNDYADAGQFAIVDQGKGLIAGYTDDEEALCKAPLPVVIFGDHTRCLKFVDFPFGMGADGVKVLKPKTGLDAKFLYHYLRQIKLPDGGYDRHFKYLKRETVPLPPLEEQRRIAAILDQAETLRTQRRTALALLDSLTQSLFLDMFGDPVANDRGWARHKIADICDLVRGSSPRPQGDPRYFGGPIPRLMVADITRDGWLVTPSIDSLTVEGARLSRPISAGTVVMAVSGNVGLVSRLAIDACVHDGFVAFKELDSGLFLPGFFLLLLHFSKQAHEKHTAGAIFQNLTTTDIKGMQVIAPPLPLQQTFATRIASIEALKATHRRALAALDALFASLQQRAFAGQL